MRKIEHVHTHALLAEVARYLIETETMSAERLSTYDALETRPSSIHKSKQNHREAITVLGNAIEPCLTNTYSESHDHSAD